MVPWLLVQLLPKHLRAGWRLQLDPPRLLPMHLGWEQVLLGALPPSRAWDCVGPCLEMRNYWLPRRRLDRATLGLAVVNWLVPVGTWLGQVVRQRC